MSHIADLMAENAAMREALQLAKAWIEYEEGAPIAHTLQVEDGFNRAGKKGFNPTFIAACRAIEAALAKSPPHEPSR